MTDKILGYRKTGKDTWAPIVQPRGYIYTAAVMTCGHCNSWISGMGGPGGHNTVCVPCYEKEQITAGADIHAGDGGYGIGTQEAYDEFVKKRNAK